MRIVLIIFSCAVAIFVLSWVFLASSLAREMRREFVAEILTNRLAYPVEIEGDVSLSMSPALAVVATGLRLPAVGNGLADLAYLKSARFTLALRQRIQGGIAFPVIEAEGLRVNLIRDADGKATWPTRDQTDESFTANSENDGNPQDLLAFLGARDIRFSDMHVRAENQETGFVFDFELLGFEVAQPEANDEAVEVTFGGNVNGEPVAFDAVYTQDAEFRGEGHVGSLTFSVDGEKAPGGSIGDFDGILSFDTPDLGSFLNVLALEGNVEGASKGSLRLTRRATHLDLDDILLFFDFGDGTQAKLAGDFGDLRFGPDFDLTLDLSPFNQGAGGKSAIYLKDVRVDQITARVIGAENTITIEDFSLETNAFQEEIRNIGPFKVERVIRHPDGRLALTGLTLSVGPKDAPYVFARGDVGSLLTLEDYRIIGEMDLPAAAMLLTLRPELAGEFGRLTGSVEIAEVSGKPVLKRFQLESAETDMWSTTMEIRVEDLTKLEGSALDLRLATPDGARFFDAIQLNPVETGPFSYRLQMHGANQRLSASSEIGLGQSTVGAGFDLYIAKNSPMLRGKVKSASLEMQDLRSAVLAGIELASLKSVYVENLEAREATSKDEDLEGFQPLVLPDAESNDPQEDMSDFQPLVLPDGPEQEDLSDFQPLIVSEGIGGLSLEDIRNPRDAVRLLDAEIDVMVERIIGQPGISRLNGGFDLKNGLLAFGPVDLAYGGGQANLRAAVNLIETPEWVRVIGQTGGWDIGEIAKSLGASPVIYGILESRFDLNGRYASPESFLNSARGQATVEMKGGRISTSLIELAGLGVLPWLFSQEKQQGFSPIVCINAPLRIDRGKITTETAVLETPRVQLVGSGTVDLKSDRISIRAEPRPVGQPLERTAWPFEVTGALSAPQVNVGKRVTRRGTMPLAMPGARVPCVPDVAQLVPADAGPSRNRPR